MFITWKGLQIHQSQHVLERMKSRRIHPNMILDTLNNPTKVESGHPRPAGVSHKIWRNIGSGKRHCVVICCDKSGRNEIVTTYVRGSGWKFA